MASWCARSAEKHACTCAQIPCAIPCSCAAVSRTHGINDIQGPLGTIAASGGGQGVMAAFLEQANGGFYEGGGRDARNPVSTITASGSQQQLVTAHLMTNTSAHPGAAAGEPVPTITSAGNQAVVECTLSPEQEAGALRVAAFLVKYYGSGIAVDPRDPLDTVTTKDRLALVTVVIKGSPTSSWISACACSSRTSCIARRASRSDTSSIAPPTARRSPPAPQCAWSATASAHHR